jgi:hypothetical protein
MGLHDYWFGLPCGIGSIGGVLITCLRSFLNLDTPVTSVAFPILRY